MRDKDTGKSKGFAFLKYEDQRSTELAVDNLGGATVLGRVMRVDHTRYKGGEDGQKDEGYVDSGLRGEEPGSGGGNVRDEEIEMLPEEVELAKLIREHDEEDPMKEYLVQEKREEVKLALERRRKVVSRKKERSYEHKYKHHHRKHDHPVRSARSS